MYVIKLIMEEVLLSIGLIFLILIGLAIFIIGCFAIIQFRKIKKRVENKMNRGV